MKLAIIQTAIHFSNVEKNYEMMREKINKAMLKNPDVIVLPELWSTGYDLENSKELADYNCNKTKEFLSDLAKKNTVNIIGGSILNKSDKGTTNTFLCFDRNGICLSEYDKVHLFKLMDEHKYLKAGNKRNFFVLDDIKSAGLVCYDIRFPEWVRIHAVEGAKVMYVVAQWPIERVEHWKAILTCRAIENQCFVVACNRCGKDPSNNFAGNSMVVSPWGETIVEADTSPTILHAEINLSDVDEIRKKIPIFSDRRTDLY